jgi:hypothetical protein
MMPLLQLFWNICLMREGPERLPSSAGFVVLIILAKFAVFVGLTFSFSMGTDLLSIATQIASISAAAALLVYFALYSRNLSSRFLPTITAYFGCELLLTAAFALFFISARALGVESQIAGFLIQLWLLFVVGFILQRALNIAFGLGVAASLFIQVFSIAVGEAAVTT